MIGEIGAAVSWIMDLNANTDSKEMKKAKPILCFEDILHQVGDWGPFQWYLTLLNILFIFFLGTVTYSPILTLFTPKHFCKVEDLQNMTMESRRNLAIPQDQEEGKNVAFQIYFILQSLASFDHFDKCIYQPLWNLF